MQAGKKQSLTNIWRKAGLDTAKINLIREVVDKELWSQPETMAQQIKVLQIKLDGFRPIEEAISCAGGVKQGALTESLELKQTSGVAVVKCWIGMLLQVDIYLQHALLQGERLVMACIYS